jgi:hypothetical protein
MKDHCPLDISFLVQGGIFPPPIGTEKVIIPWVLSSQKRLEDHLFWSKEFAKTMDNISIIFQLNTIKKDVIKGVLQKNL